MTISLCSGVRWFAVGLAVAGCGSDGVQTATLLVCRIQGNCAAPYGCWCDPSCADYGDCCEDIDVCGF